MQITLFLHFTYTFLQNIQLLGIVSEVCNDSFNLLDFLYVQVIGHEICEHIFNILFLEF